MTFRLLVFAILSLIVAGVYRQDFEGDGPNVTPGLFAIVSVATTVILFTVVVMRSLLVER